MVIAQIPCTGVAVVGPKRSMRVVSISCMVIAQVPCTGIAVAGPKRSRRVVSIITWLLLRYLVME